MIKKEKKISVNLQSDDTDSLLPRAWKSGSLKYDELKPLSEGGTAKLFTTLDLNLRRDVAYKTYILTLGIQKSKRRISSRGTCNCKYQHPGTVPLYELGRDREGQLFFTMKKVEGRDLREILFDLRQEVPDVVEKFPFPRLIDILIQVSQTIAYAHEIGVIHRDLKPANIIIGQFGEVYVLDWGLAKIIGSESIVEPEDLETQKADTTLTPVGKHYGTRCICPQKWLKEKPILMDELMFSHSVFFFMK